MKEEKMNLILGDCLDKLKELDDNSIESIVTDPPYGLAFMGKKWDYDVPSQEIWEQCLRVLKHGGHLLAFAGSRTYHRMAVRIEDAGFEIRDQIMWVYGSGFPKSHNIALAIDKMDGKISNRGSAINLAGKGDRNDIKTSVSKKNGTLKEGYTSDNAWNGWGTALKPAHEPIVMARKPFKGSVAENVLEWGTGGINIDGCRIQHDEPVKTTTRTEKGDTWNDKNTGLRNNLPNMASADPKGRFPANVIFDEEAGKLLDEQSGTRKGFSGGGGPTRFGGATGGEKLKTYNYHNDTGGASRFFYCPKASKKDKNEGVDGNVHPTVKPTDLMLYLIRLVTPKGGTTLDPFMGSGSTGKAAVRGGFEFVGIEREKDYFQIAEARIKYEIDNSYIEGKINEFS